jgi:hypothetical protein
LGVPPNEFLPNDGAHIYNNIVTSQKGNGFVINQAEKAIELYDKLLQTKDALIISLQNQIKQIEIQHKKANG